MSEITLTETQKNVLLAVKKATDAGMLARSEAIAKEIGAEKNDVEEALDHLCDIGFISASFLQ